MAKNKKIVHYRKPFHLNIGLIVFGVIFVYMMFYVYSYFTSEHISVYEVIHGTIAVNNSYTGIALRKEEVVPSNYSGEVNYYKKDASKVGVGSLIYSVDEDGAIAGQINAANDDVSSLDQDVLDEIEKNISEFVNGYRSEAFYNVDTFKNDLNAALSATLSIGVLNSIADAATAAEGQSTFHKGTAEKDGIVVYYTDGFETATPESLKQEMFDEALYKKQNLKERTRIGAGEAAYKLITDESWQLVIPIGDEIRRQLEDSSTVLVKFKKDGTKTRANAEIQEKNGKARLILSLSHSMVRFATDRYVEVELLLDDEAGLKIPNSAVTEKNFFTVPMECFQKGSHSNEDGIMIRRSDRNGKTTDSFITPTIYFATEYAYYVDSEEILDGDVVLKPGSDETYTIHETAKLEGVYSINKGYAVFKQIDVIYQNEEYSIIRSGTDYGISLYDHIALDGSVVMENDIIKK